MLSQVVEAHKSTLVTVHSDNGGAMTSKNMHALLERESVELSTIRPGVFDDIHHARAWFADYARAYKNEHHHTSLAGFTPGEVYDGSWQATAEARQVCKDAAYAAHPQRYRSRPQVKIPPPQVTLNFVNHGENTHYPSTLLEPPAA